MRHIFNEKLFFFILMPNRLNMWNILIYKCPQVGYIILQSLRMLFHSIPFKIYKSMLSIVLLRNFFLNSKQHNLVFIKLKPFHKDLLKWLKIAYKAQAPSVMQSKFNIIKTRNDRTKRLYQTILLHFTCTWKIRHDI